LRSGIGPEATISLLVLRGLSPNTITPLSIKGPARFDLSAYAGDTFSVDIAIAQDGSPVDVTGWTFTAQVRAKRAGAVAATFTVNVTDAAQGELTISLSGATTATLASGVWDLNVALPDGTVSTLVDGVITVTQDVTRSE
jgi:hypothetical protein